MADDKAKVLGRTINGDLIVHGNIGIGTATPTAKLDVKGDIKMDGILTGKKLDIDGDIRANNYTGINRYSFMMLR